MIEITSRFALILLVIMCAVIYYAMRVAGKGRIPPFRKLPAIEAIPEAVGRAAEMGRPVHVSPGSMEMTSAFAAEMVVGMDVINYTSKFAVEKGSEIICTIEYTDNQLLAEEAIRSAFVSAGKPEEYDPRMVRFAPYGVAYDTMVMGIAERERPAANIIIGSWYHPCLYLIEAMNNVGALTIGGTTRITNTPFFVGACDYFLIGEEVMVAGAVVAGIPAAQGSFWGQDICKYISIIIILVGAVSVSLGTNIIKLILGW